MLSVIRRLRPSSSSDTRPQICNGLGATAFAFLLAFWAIPVSAQENLFREIDLAYDISLEVPSHWQFLSLDERRNISAASRSIMDNEAVTGSNGQKRTLLALNATPAPAGAIIRVSVTAPPDYSPAELEAMTPAELASVGPELLNIMRRAERSGALEVLEMNAARIERVDNHLALVISYTRAGAIGPSPWSVTQYHIPFSDYLVEISLSHRLADKVLWRPILERVKRSVRF